MRLLTFNLWHGLSPKGPLAFEALEPDGRRHLRERLQVEVLKKLNPDICLFQEVNPVVPRVGQLARALGMSAEYQPDLVGTKLFGAGFPLNLNSGLAILSQQNLGLRWVNALSLSRPGVRLVRNWASWQLREERFAVFCETLIPNWGRVLLVNTHLHHGLENTPEFMNKIHDLADELALSPSMMADLKERVVRGDQRRKNEAQVLLEELDRLEKRYEVILIGGDFNAEPRNALFEPFKARGFRDVWAEAQPETDGFTFDRLKNEANHVLQSHFPAPLMVEDLTFSGKVKDALVQLARAQDGRPRRIDYLWMRSRSVQIHVNSVELVGSPNPEGLAPSDHFGVCADLEAY